MNGSFSVFRCRISRAYMVAGDHQRVAVLAGVEGEEQMSVGINYSEHDRTYTWADLKPREMSVLERSYRKALAEYEEAFDRYIEACDFLNDMRVAYGDDSSQAINAQVALNRCSDLCDQAEDKRSKAWMKWNCPHTHVKAVKAIDVSEYKVCVMCGASEDEFHNPILPISIGRIA